jgi:hypothetical protein
MVSSKAKHGRCAYLPDTAVQWYRPVGDGAGLAQTILDLLEDPAALQRMVERTRQAFEVEFDKPIALGHWEQVLREVKSFCPSPLDPRRPLGPGAASAAARGRATDSGDKARNLGWEVRCFVVPLTCRMENFAERNAPGILGNILI